MTITKSGIQIADCVLDEMGRCPASDDEVRELLDLLDKHNIVSPPEQLFLYSWIRIVNNISIYPQTPIGNYKADFTISSNDHFSNGYFHEELIKKMKLPVYVVEIDGFEWHDKTPEQAEHDRKRDRFMTAEGYSVIRFSAREVFRAPFDCVTEVSNRIYNDIQSVYERLTIN